MVDIEYLFMLFRRKRMNKYEYSYKDKTKQIIAKDNNSCNPFATIVTEYERNKYTLW